jgi:hypothetical protein
VGQLHEELVSYPYFDSHSDDLALAVDPLKVLTSEST